MAQCGEFLKSHFPVMDEELKKYIEDILDNSAGEFEDTEEVFEAVGEILQGISQKSEDDIREICDMLLKMMQPDKNSNINGPRKVLDAPITLSSMNTPIQDAEDMKSIWVQTRDDTLKVDAKKLEKAEAKLQQKQQKQKDAKLPVSAPVLQTATASQVTSKKDSKLEAKGTNRTQDIRIENFDIAYGDRVLLQGADLVLAFGRRYGLVGRNGLGKTTLLRMISSKQLKIPSHISILHVEQEVVGDDTIALQSVLECDTVRENLLRREKEITAAINSGSTDQNLSTELSEVYAQLENIEADKAPARASIILSGLGFTPEMQTRSTKTFSGGWRMRLALARALFSKGNYDQFHKTKTEKHKNQQREYEAQQQHRAHTQEFIDRFRYNANRASSVQSKIKMLEKLPELKPVEKEIDVVLRFPETEPLSPPILQLNEVGFYYSKDKVIFSNVNLGATLESRICIVGDNGAGKTTLLKIIMGILSPTSGIRSVHRGLKFGYFSQHHVDQLEMNVNSVELLQKSYPGKTVEEYRRQLGSFGVSGDLALQTIGSLSGGQKSRVAFARMCMGNPNFLVLDEPTNHLDIETIEALGKGINKYTGGVILVSHDERLIRMVCRELWVCGGGSVTSIEGGFDEYRKIVERELEANK
ncbi:putative ATP-dependent transporter [Danaus plexippus plexippus]|uniref:ATP-dependent transporter n=1 Tax=Danaus plexippus plexippus TaxID=278856 RepID=A0A212ETI6_DANPL|nr:putative ATP-dependent transporter [Danaus plexippus plexippus]